MKNVLRITVKGFYVLTLFALLGVQAQEMTSLEPIIGNELTTMIAEKTSGVSVYVVKGSVVDQDNLPLEGVNVYLKGTSAGIVTDSDGKFEWPNKLDVGKVLVFSYIGYNPQEYTVVESDSETIEVAITFDLSDISLMGAVEVEGVYKSKRNVFQKFIDLFR